MTLYCVKCGHEIPAERARRNAVTCSDSCQREYRNRRRQDSASKKCRLCHRRFRRKAAGDPVLMEHRPLQESDRTEILCSA